MMSKGPLEVLARVGFLHTLIVSTLCEILRVSPEYGEGTDSADCGTIAIACKTIQFAINKSHDGDTVTLLPGTHRPWGISPQNATLEPNEWSLTRGINLMGKAITVSGTTAEVSTHILVLLSPNLSSRETGRWWTVAAGHSVHFTWILRRVRKQYWRV